MIMSSTNFLPMYLKVELFILFSGSWPFQQRNSSLVLENFFGTIFFFFFLSHHPSSVKPSGQCSSVWRRKGSRDKVFYFSCRVKIEHSFFVCFYFCFCFFLDKVILSLWHLLKRVLLSFGRSHLTFPFVK